MTEEITKLRAQAVKCRRLADWIDDRRTLESLRLIAEQSDAEADRLEASEGRTEEVS